MEADDIELSQTALESGIIMMESGSMMIMDPDDELSQTALENGIIMMESGSVSIMVPDDIEHNQTTSESGEGLMSAIYNVFSLYNVIRSLTAFLPSLLNFKLFQF